MYRVKLFILFHSESSEQRYSHYEGLQMDQNRKGGGGLHDG